MSRSRTGVKKATTTATTTVSLTPAYPSVKSRVNAFPFSFSSDQEGTHVHTCAHTHTHSRGIWHTQQQAARGVQGHLHTHLAQVIWNQGAEVHADVHRAGGEDGRCRAGQGG